MDALDEIRSQAGSPKSSSPDNDTESQNRDRVSQLQFATQVPQGFKPELPEVLPAKGNVVNTTDDLLSLYRPRPNQRNLTIAQQQLQGNDSSIQGREAVLEKGGGKNNNKADVGSDMAKSTSNDNPKPSTEAPSKSEDGKSERLQSLGKELLDQDVHTETGVSNPKGNEAVESAIIAAENPSLPEKDPFEGLRQGLKQGKYLPRRLFQIPRDQQKILKSNSSWQPPLVGQRAPHGCMPPKLLEKLVDVAETVENQDSSDNDSTDEAEDEAKRQNDLLISKATQPSPSQKSASGNAVVLEFGDLSGDDSDEETRISWSASPTARQRQLPPDSSPSIAASEPKSTSNAITYPTDSNKIDVIQSIDSSTAVKRKHSIEEHEEGSAAKSSFSLQDNLPVDETSTQQDSASQNDNQKSSESIVQDLQTDNSREDDSGKDMSKVKENPNVQVKRTPITTAPSKPQSPPHSSTQPLPPSQSFNHSENGMVTRIPATFNSSFGLQVSSIDPNSQSQLALNSHQATDTSDSRKFELSETKEAEEIVEAIPPPSPLEDPNNIDPKEREQPESFQALTEVAINITQGSRPAPSTDLLSHHDNTSIISSTNTKRSAPQNSSPLDGVLKRRRVNDSSTQESPALWQAAKDQIEMAQASRRDFFRKQKHPYIGPELIKGKASPAQLSSKSSLRKDSSDLGLRRRHTPATSLVQDQHQRSASAAQASLETTFRDFGRAYEKYAGTLAHFQRSCQMIIDLQRDGKAPHMFLWDDFIFRFRDDYVTYQLEQIEAGIESIPYIQFYNEYIRQPKYIKGVTNPDILKTFVATPEHSASASNAGEQSWISKTAPSQLSRVEFSRQVEEQPYLIPPYEYTKSGNSRSIAASSSASNLGPIQAHPSGNMSAQSQQLSVAPIEPSSSSRVESWLKRASGEESPVLGDTHKEGSQVDIPMLELDEVQESEGEASENDQPDGHEHQISEDDLAEEVIKPPIHDSDDETAITNEPPDDTEAWWYDQNTAFKEWARAHEKMARRKEGLQVMNVDRRGNVLPILNKRIDIGSWRR